MESIYTQLTLVERYQIESFVGLGFSARSIGLRLSRSNTTISRELSRCEGLPYDAEIAHQNALGKRHGAAKATKRNEQNLQMLDKCLHIDLSPEQVAGRMQLEAVEQAPSRSTLYRWIGHLNWRKRLPRRGKPRRKLSGQYAGAKLIPNRIDIEHRPAVVDKNTEMGHWEGDTVHGKDAYLVTLVERTTKVLLTARVPDKTKRSVTDAINRLMKPFAKLCKTITFDNGGEFADHEKVANKLNCKIFFAKPYHSWQRGLNENTNGLLRRYFPKSMHFGDLKQSEIDQAQFLINNRPRKSLNYRTPMEVLAGKTVPLILGI